MCLKFNPRLLPYFRFYSTTNLINYKFKHELEFDTNISPLDIIVGTCIQIHMQELHVVTKYNTL
jgi:hypothetical protein